MLKKMDRKQLLDALNKAFSESEIKKTAKVSRSLSAKAGLGDLSEALGIIPKAEAKIWRQSTARIPVLIATALNDGIREHLRTINRTKTTRFAGPKALHFAIVDGDSFGLRVVQRPTRTELTITMRNRPLAT
jgi:hypothetical protein